MPERNIRIKTTTVKEIYYTIKELEDLVMGDADDGAYTDTSVEVRWDECSQGGINGCTVIETTVETN